MLEPPPDHSPSQPVAERYDPLRVLGILLIPCVLLTVGLALWVLATHDGPGPRLAVAYEPVVTTDAPDAPDAFVPAAPRDPASAVRHQLLRSAFEDDLAMLRAPRRSLVAPDAGRDRTYIAYTVELGDTVSAIAERYGVSAASIVASNVHIEREDELHAGVGILIPAAEGVLYGVSEGDTLESIAALYGSSAESIAAFPGNRIADPDQLPVGTLVLIPGGRAPAARGVPAVSPISPSFPLPPAGIAAVAALPGVASGIWLWPVDSHRITSQYGPRHPLGIDVGASMRSPIYAASAGRVVFAGGDPCCSYGYYMDVDHGGGYRTRYAHVDEFRVGVGTMVASGQVIGLTGNNGRSTGPHLHFEVLRHGVQVDPMTYLGNAFVPAPVALVQALPSGARAKKNTPSLAGGGSGRGGPDVTAISWRTTAADPAREAAAQAEADRRSAVRAAEREAESVRRAQERRERDALRSAQAAAQAAERQRLDAERAQRAEQRAATRAAEAARIAEAGRLRHEARSAARAERELEAARLAEERRLHDEAEAARLALERTEREQARAAERLAAREATAAKRAEERRLKEEERAAARAESKLKREAEAARVALERAEREETRVAERLAAREATAAKRAEERRLKEEGRAAARAESKLKQKAEAARVAAERLAAREATAAKRAEERRLKEEARAAARAESKLKQEAESARVAAERLAKRQAAEAKRAEELRVREAARAERDAAKARRADERRQPPAAETTPAPAPTPADEAVTVPAGEAA